MPVRGKVDYSTNLKWIFIKDIRMQGEDYPPSPEQGAEEGVDKVTTRSGAATATSPVCTILLSGAAFPQCTSRGQVSNQGVEIHCCEKLWPCVTRSPTFEGGFTQGARAITPQDLPVCHWYEHIGKHDLRECSKSVQDLSELRRRSCGGIGLE